MNIIKKAYCRIFQTFFRIVLPILPYKDPQIKNSIDSVADILKTTGNSHPLIITDKNLSQTGAVKMVTQSLDKNNITYSVFDEVFPNPTTDLAKKAFLSYGTNNCDSIIALGGGSPMDLAKAVGILAVKPNAKLEKLAGILKVRKTIPLVIAIPTTAGTGSETTLASVLIHSETNHKFAINDFPLIPPYAILDPITLHTLPAFVASATGMDALTHAVEAYIGRSTTKKTRQDSEKAVELIFKNLDDAVNHKNTESEKAMLYASHFAGRAFTRSYVGYIHAVSHSLSGKYNLPHGLTNAILLPLVLKRYGKKAEKKLARLAVCAGLGTTADSSSVLASRFISAIENMNRKYNIPSRIDCIRESDIPALALYAHKEANPLYPVPVLWGRKELEEIYRLVKSN